MEMEKYTGINKEIDRVLKQSQRVKEDFFFSHSLDVFHREQEKARNFRKKLNSPDNRHALPALHRFVCEERRGVLYHPYSGAIISNARDYASYFPRSARPYAYDLRAMQSIAAHEGLFYRIQSMLYAKRWDLADFLIREHMSIWRFGKSGMEFSAIVDNEDIERIYNETGGNQAEIVALCLWGASKNLLAETDEAFLSRRFFNYFLLVTKKRENQEFHYYPGGKVDEGETIYEALIREVKEELPDAHKEHALLEAGLAPYMGSFLFDSPFLDTKRAILVHTFMLPIMSKQFRPAREIHKVGMYSDMDFYPDLSGQLILHKELRDFAPAQSAIALNTYISNRMKMLAHWLLEHPIQG